MYLQSYLSRINSYREREREFIPILQRLKTLGLLCTNYSLECRGTYICIYPHTYHQGIEESFPLEIPKLITTPSSLFYYTRKSIPRRAESLINRSIPLSPIRSGTSCTAVNFRVFFAEESRRRLLLSPLISRRKVVFHD